jgi:hypothetical protein
MGQAHTSPAEIAHGMRGMITLGDMQAKDITMLGVACRRCDRRGRLKIARIIVEHGRDGYGDLRRLIAADCPRMQKPSADIYDRCGVHFPELPKWFRSRLPLLDAFRGFDFVVQMGRLYVIRVVAHQPGADELAVMPSAVFGDRGCAAVVVHQQLSAFIGRSGSNRGPPPLEVDEFLGVEPIGPAIGPKYRCMMPAGRWRRRLSLRPNWRSYHKRR